MSLSTIAVFISRSSGAMFWSVHKGQYFFEIWTYRNSNWKYRQKYDFIENSELNPGFNYENTDPLHLHELSTRRIELASVWGCWCWNGSDEENGWILF